MSEQNRPAARRARNLGLAAVAGQAGCWTIVIVFVALFLGLWLDSQMGQRGLFTFGLVILSIPVSLMVMLRIAVSAINRIDPPEYVNTERESSSHTEEV
ncbi:MAG: hypothetical protein ACOCZH_01135 [Phototrophicaceae bacterium]